MKNCRLSDSVKSVFNFKSFCIYIETLSFVYLYISFTEQMRLEGISGDCPAHLLCWSYKSLIGLSVCKDRLPSLSGWAFPCSTTHTEPVCAPFPVTGYCWEVPGSIFFTSSHQIFKSLDEILPQSPLHSNLTSAHSLGLTGGMCQPFNQLNHLANAGPLPVSILFNVLFWNT